MTRLNDTEGDPPEGEGDIGPPASPTPRPTACTETEIETAAGGGAPRRWRQGCKRPRGGLGGGAELPEGFGGAAGELRPWSAQPGGLVLEPQALGQGNVWPPASPQCSGRRMAGLARSSAYSHSDGEGPE